LPPLAVEAARSAAGMGGSVSARVASLAEAALHQRATLKPLTIVALTAALAAVALGLLLWRGLSAPNKAGPGAPTQVWQAGPTIQGQEMFVWHLAFSPDKETLVSQAGEAAVRLWDRAGKPKGVLSIDNGQSQLFVGFTPDSRELVTVGAEGPVAVWDTATAKEVARYPGGSWTTTLAPDGKSVATVRPDAVHVIDLAMRQDRPLPDLLPGPIYSLAFSPDSATLAIGSGDGTIFLYDRTTLQQRRRLPGNATPTLELAFSPDGTTLAALYGQRRVVLEPVVGEVLLWQLATGQSRGLLPAHRAYSLAFAPDGQTLATEDLNGVMNLWDPVSGTHRLRIGGPLVTSRLFRVVFSPDGKAIVAPTPGGVQLRDTTTGHVLATLRGHSASVSDAAFSADGRTLATGTMGRQIEEAQPARPAEIRIWERVE
jgi:WD40 repeat protein